MTLHELFQKVAFDEVFDEIKRFVPEIEPLHEDLLSAYSMLKMTPPGEDDDETVSVTDLSYLGKGVHSTGINAAYYFDRDLLRTLVARQIKRSDSCGRTADGQELSDVQIAADCLWEFAAVRICWRGSQRCGDIPGEILLSKTPELQFEIRARNPTSRQHVCR